MIKTGEEKANPPLFLQPYAIRSLMEGWNPRELLEKVWEQDPAPYNSPVPDMFQWEAEAP